MSIPYPHDSFCKASLKEHMIGLDFLQTYLPENIYQRLLLDTLDTSGQQFEKYGLKSLRNDIVYQCQIQLSTLKKTIIILVEHQSEADQYVGFRMLEYSVHLIRDYFRANKKDIPLVYHMCIYHGSQSPYPYSTDIYEDLNKQSIEDEGLFHTLLSKPFQLIDLTQISIETLKKHGFAAIMEILLKISRWKDNLLVIRELAEEGFLRKTIDSTSQAYFSDMFDYSIECEDNEGEAGELFDIFIRALPEKRKTIMTYAQQLKQRGLEEGRLAVEKDCQLKIAKKLLEINLKHQDILEATGLTEDDFESLVDEV